MRNDTKPFDDVRVRQALALAIDRQAIVDTLYQGKADVANDHVFAPSFPQSAAVINAIPQRTQDIEKAKSLLAEAGYPDGIELTVTSEQYSDIPAYLQLVQSQVADAGITLNLDLKSQADYYGSVGNEPWLEVPLGSTDWGERATPSAMLATAYISGAPFNESKFDSKEFDAAVAAYDAETDPDKRAEAAIKAAQILHDEVPSIIAFFPKLLRASSSAVSGLPAGPISSIDLTGVAKQ
jgi:peptide/nickel transport system substrate-binding protein